MKIDYVRVLVLIKTNSKGGLGFFKWKTYDRQNTITIWLVWANYLTKWYKTFLNTLYMSF